MTQKEFASALEWRICREFTGMADGRLRNKWCDGVSLTSFLLTDEAKPRIMGIAWICEGAHQEEWRLELLLPRPLASEAEINWEELLPPENMTRWLALDEKRKLIQIEPSAAVPDLL